MVHALKEAHRVLVPNGVMVDERPLSLDMPLEIVHSLGSVSAGLVDMSPGREIDIAADLAINAVIGEGLFEESRLEFFDFTYNWTTFEGMEQDITENWVNELVIPEQVRQRALELFIQLSPIIKIRVPSRMKLGVYTKQT